MCQTGVCSKVRCRLYAFVSGQQTEIVQKVKDPRRCGACGYGGDDCKNGTFCDVTRGVYDTVTRDFGNDWDTFMPYVKLLGRAFIARLRGKSIPNSL
jgi:hypothetical protein